MPKSVRMKAKHLQDARKQKKANTKNTKKAEQKKADNKKSENKPKATRGPSKAKVLLPKNDGFVAPLAPPPKKSQSKAAKTTPALRNSEHLATSFKAKTINSTSCIRQFSKPYNPMPRSAPKPPNHATPTNVPAHPTKPIISPKSPSINKFSAIEQVFHKSSMPIQPETRISNPNERPSIAATYMNHKIEPIIATYFNNGSVPSDNGAEAGAAKPGRGGKTRGGGTLRSARSTPRSDSEEDLHNSFKQYMKQTSRNPLANNDILDEMVSIRIKNNTNTCSLVGNQHFSSDLDKNILSGGSLAPPIAPPVAPPIAPPVAPPIAPQGTDVVRAEGEPVRGPNNAFVLFKVLSVQTSKQNKETNIRNILPKPENIRFQNHEGTTDKFGDPLAPVKASKTYQANSKKKQKKFDVFPDL